jgi:membrane-associated phospholipid phosphatase
MNRFIITAWLLVFSFISAFSQSPYQLKFGREIGLYSAGLSLGTGGILFGNKMKPLTEAQILNLNASDLTKFERWVTTRSSVRSHNTSNILLISSNLCPVILTLADNSMRKDAGKIGVIYTQAAFINLGLTALVKSTVRRTRPYAYQTELSLEEKMTVSARQSFWSGHTSQSATMCFLTAQMFADYHPDSKWRPVMWTAAAAIPLATGILRMTSGKHFPTDVITGYATGAAIGLLLPRLHRRINR